MVGRAGQVESYQRCYVALLYPCGIWRDSHIILAERARISGFRKYVPGHVRGLRSVVAYLHPIKELTMRQIGASIWRVDDPTSDQLSAHAGRAPLWAARSAALVDTATPQSAPSRTA